MIKKLRSTRGETLAEILVSIVILGLSIGLLLTMVMTSTKITQYARQADNDLMTELNAAEQQLNPYAPSDDPYPKVKIKLSDSDYVEVPVELYASSDGSALISYKAK